MALKFPIRRELPIGRSPRKAALNRHKDGGQYAVEAPVARFRPSWGTVLGPAQHGALGERRNGGRKALFPKFPDRYN